MIPGNSYLFVEAFGGVSFKVIFIMALKGICVVMRGVWPHVCQLLHICSHPSFCTSHHLFISSKTNFHIQLPLYLCIFPLLNDNTLCLQRIRKYAHTCFSDEKKNATTTYSTLETNGMEWKPANWVGNPKFYPTYNANVFIDQCIG